MPKVSLIVPTYNVEQYLVECMESITNQTLEDIEVICINDGSTDGSLSILQSYADKDKRIIIVDKENGGYGIGMNIGLEMATGEYIGIVEPDDFVPVNMFGNLYDIAKGNNLDFVKADFYRFERATNGDMFLTYNHLSKKEEDYNVVFNPSETPEAIRWIMNTWSGIYKREFLIKNNIRHNETPGASYQDTGFATLVTLLSKKMCFLEGHYYKYRKDNEGSSVKSNRKYKCIVDEFIWLRSRLKELGCDSDVDEAFFKETRLRAFFWNYSRLSEEYQEKFLHLEYVKKAALDFDESVLGYKIPDKEMKLKILSGDTEIREIENRKQSEYIEQYDELLKILQAYKKIVIVCSGKYGQSIYRLIKAADCKAGIYVCDNFTRGKMKEFDERYIFSVEETVAANKEACFIIANSNLGSELRKQVIGLGAEEKDIYLYERNFISGNVGALYNIIKKCEDSN